MTPYEFDEFMAGALAYYLLRHGACEAVTGVCTGRSHEVHHRLMKSQGGHRTDYRNLLAVCWPCHRWIHAHPAESYDKGWLLHRYSEGAIMQYSDSDR